MLNLPGLNAPASPGMTIGSPAIDFVALARSLGVEAHRIEDLGKLTDRVRDSFSLGRPILFDVPVSD